MQPTPVKTILCPSDSRKPKLSKDGLKRKASADDSRRKFIKVVDDSVATALTSAHRVDVSNVSSHDKTADPVLNGRSRTPFSCGTVRGEKIFLDLKDGHLIEDLERYIKKFGGVIEKFLSKDITCVVTSRVNVVNVRTEERGMLSPSLVEEKTPKKTECGLNSAAMSRGKALLLRSNSMKSSATICDPVQFAHTWNIPVVEVTVLRKLLKRENLYRKQVTLGNSKESLKELDTPFVKVEDMMQEYSANFKLFDAFPSGHPSSHSRVHRGPSDQAAGKRQKSKQKNPKKAGYCECCDLMFIDRAEHFQSEKHQAFIAHSENFTGLDALVSELPSLEMFVQAMEMGVTGLPLAPNYGSKVDNVALCCGFLDSYVRNSMLEPPPFLQSVPLGSEYNIPGPAKVGSNRPAVFQESKRSGIDTPSRSLSSGKKQRSDTGSSRRSSLHLYPAGKNTPSSAAKYTFDDINSFIRKSPVQKFENADNSCNNSPVDLSLAKTSTAVLADRSPPCGAGGDLPIACDFNRADVDETLNVADISAGRRVVITGDEVSKTCDLGAKNTDCHSTVSLEMSSEIATNEMHCVKAKCNVSTDIETKDPVNVNAKCSSTVDCINKEDDLDFSSDEVNDSADDRADWRVALRSSCNKVLDILEDSVLSKGSMLDVVVDLKLDKTEMTPKAKRSKGSRGGVVGKLVSVAKQPSLNINTRSSLNSPAVQEITAAVGENVLKETTKVLTAEKPPDEKCASKTSGGFVRPWEFVSTKSNFLRQPSSQTTFDVKTRPMREPDECFPRRSPSAMVENVSKVLANEGLELKSAEPCDGGSKCSASVIYDSSLSAVETYRISSEGVGGADGKAKAVYGIKGEVERCVSPSGTSESSVEVDVEGCDDRSVDLEDFTAASVSEHGPVSLSKHGSEPSPGTCSGGLDARIGDEPLETDLGDRAPVAPLDSAITPASLQPFDEHGWQGNVKRFSSFVDAEEEKAEQGPASVSCDNDSAVFARMTTENSERKSQSPEKDFLNAEEKVTKDGQISETDKETVCSNSDESTRDEQFMDVEKCEPAGDEQVTEIDDERVGEDLQAATSLANENSEDSDESLENALKNEQSFPKPPKHSVASPVNVTDEVLGRPTGTLDLKEDLLLPPCSLSNGEKSVSTHEENSAFDGVTVEQNSLSSDHLSDDDDISLPRFVCNKEENESRSSSINKISDGPPISELISVEISKGFAAVEPPTAETVENESHDSPLISDEMSDSLPALFVSIQPAREPAETSVVSDSAEGEDLICAVQDDQNPIDKTPSHDTMGSAHDTVMSAHDTMGSAHDSTRSDSLIEDPKLFVNSDTLEDNIADANSGISAGDIDNAERNAKEFGNSSVDLELNETVPAEDSTACVQSPLSACTFPPNQETLESVAEVKAYPDLMDGIDESTNRLKVQMPDLLIPVKSAMSAALTASHVTCGFVGFGCETTKSGVVSDLPFEECQVDFLDQKPGLITLYGVSKDEDAPLTNISQTSLCSHEDRDKDTLDPWPDELVNVDRSDWSEKNCPPVTCAPIATPPYVCFEEEPSAQVRALSESQSAASLTAPVSNLADSAVLDDDVLTTLSKILEDASKEWQAERQKSKTSSDRGVSYALNQPQTGVEVDALSAGNDVPGNELTLKSAAISSFTTNNENSICGTFEIKTDCPPVDLEDTDGQLHSSELTPDAGYGNNVTPEAPEEPGTANSTSQPSVVMKDRGGDAAGPTYGDSVSSAKPEEDDRVDLDKLMDMLRELNGEKDCSDEFEFKPPLTTEGEHRGFCETCVVHGGSRSLQDATTNFCDRPEERRLFSGAKKNAQKKPDALAFQHIPTSALHSLNSLNKERDTGLACDCRMDEGFKKSKKFLWRVISVSGLKIRVRRFPVGLESTGRCCRTKTWSANSIGNKELTLHFAHSKSNRDKAKC